ncbi:MAG: elongation factor Ts [Patescibacteria group bacterium]
MATTEEIKQLRDETGVSIMQCKKALEEAGGDMEKARVILRKASSAIAAKKSDRTLSAGVAASYVHAGGAVVGAVILGCETDFVAKNPDFSKLAYDIAMHVAAMNPQFLRREDVQDADIAAAKSVFEDEAKDKPAPIREKVVQGKLDAYVGEKTLLEQAFVKDSSKTIRQLIEEATQKFGEKMEITRFVRLSVR